MKRLVRVGFVIVLASVPSFATTWVVDAAGGPGSQFLDIGAAINAASAGDVILVRPGTYPAFASSKGLAILGQGGVNVNGAAVFVGVPAPERSVLAAVSAQAVIVDSCDGPVIVQDVQSQQVRVISSSDVRCRAVSSSPAAGPPVHALTVESSRVELVDCDLDGSSGFASGQSGGNGVHAFSAGRLFVTASSSNGGAGKNSVTDQTPAGDGGDAVHIESGSTLRIAGGSAHGGTPGFCEGFQCSLDCSFDGGEGHALVSESSSVDYFASTSLQGSGYFSSPHCNFVCCMPFFGSGFTRVTPVDPELSTSGTPAAGQILTFTVSGPPGAPATLWLGRGLLVQPTPGVDVELLVPRARVLSLGAMPAAGTITRTFLIPGNVPAGFGFAAQAEVLLPSGEVRRTSSSPIVVR